jgi:hypothetical protein
MSVSAGSARRPARFVGSLALCAMLLVSMFAVTSSASAKTTKVKVKASITIDDSHLVGNVLWVTGHLVAAVPDATVDLSGRKIEVAINGHNVICVAKTSVEGTFTCHAVVNSAVRKLLRDVGFVARFTGGTVHGLLHFLSHIDVDVSAAVSAVIRL